MHSYSALIQLDLVLLGSLLRQVIHANARRLGRVLTKTLLELLLSNYPVLLRIAAIQEQSGSDNQTRTNNGADHCPGDSTLGETTATATGAAVVATIGRILRRTGGRGG